MNSCNYTTTVPIRYGYYDYCIPVLQIVEVMGNYKSSFILASLLMGSGLAVIIEVNTQLAALLPSLKTITSSLLLELPPSARAPPEGLVISNTKRCPPYLRIMEALMVVAPVTAVKVTVVKDTVVKVTVVKVTVVKDTVVKVTAVKATEEEDLEEEEEEGEDTVDEVQGR